MPLITYLKTIFLFENLDNNHLEQVSHFASLVKFRKGETLFSDGDSADSIFGLISGQVKIFKLSPRGDEHILLIINEIGEVFAEAAIYDLETYPANCQAMKITQAIRLSKKELRQFILDNPQVALKMMSAYSRRLRQFVKITEDLVFHDVKSRLARFIIENSTICNNNRICPILSSKKELASLLGTIPETLSRTLHYFKAKHIIAEEKGKIFILDAKQLEAFLD